MELVTAAAAAAAAAAELGEVDLAAVVGGNSSDTDMPDTDGGAVVNGVVSGMPSTAPTPVGSAPDSDNGDLTRREAERRRVEDGIFFAVCETGGK